MQETERSRLLETLKEMQYASDLIDEAYGGSDYNMRLVALALIAREFLRRNPAAALAADGGAVSRPQEKAEDDPARSPSTATISRAGSTARAEGET